MGNNRLFIIFFPFLSLLSFLISCDSEDDPSANTVTAHCVPINRKSGTDSIVYSYNAEKKPISVSYYTTLTKQIKEKYELGYNSGGQLVEAVRIIWLGSGPEPLNHFELIYNGKATPQSLHTWGPVKTDPPMITNFFYDGSGRLVRREQVTGNDPIVVRYEYNDSGNVTRIYYKNQQNPEVLARENGNFDNKSRFYGALPELALFYRLIMKYDPSENNILSSSIYYIDPFTPAVPTHQSNYNLSYNSDGLIIKSVLSAPAPFGDNLFLDLKYECH